MFSIMKSIPSSAFKMSTSATVKVNPDVLKWLRVSSGWTIEEISSNLEVPVDTVTKWEKGIEHPTFAYISKMAKAFKRPSAAFFLPKPATEPPLPNDFRKLPNTAKGFTRKTIEAMRRARNLQVVSKELMENLGAEVKPDIVTASLRDDPEKVAFSERKRLGVSIADQTGCKDKHKAFKMWRGVIERANILLFQFPMEIEELRGFTILDSMPYAIVLNSSDDVQARIFTMFHEYGHILLHEPALCIPESPTHEKHGAEVESWCNRFAGAFLLPAEEISTDFGQLGISNYYKISSRYRVSLLTTLTRLVSLGLITNDEYACEKGILEAKNKEQKEQTGGGPGETCEQRAQREMGEGFVSLVLENSQKGFITDSKALDYLDIKTKHLQELIKQTQ
jgi:Zn-dependent peptidase ImmA (M78 family)/transcriptional regulator with XRE-family HTH domain